jgi:hypothetical protein
VRSAPPVDRRQPAGVKALADQRRCHPVAAADLEDAIVRSDLELIDDPLEALTHEMDMTNRSRC